MSTITLPNIRVGSDLTVRVRLKDGGVAIDWSTLTNIRAHIYSDAQRALAGRCSVSVDAEDPTVLVCVYAATKPQYLGVNRIIVQANYMGETKTYDKPVFSYVRWTADQEGEEITIEDPDIAVELEVEDVTSSILQNILNACIKATEEAREVVDTSRGPRGYSAYEIAVQDGYEGTEEEWLASLVGPAGESAYQLAVDQGYEGTLPEWLASLHGADGDSAYQIAVEEGFVGTKAQWLASLVGPQGLSAYQVAVVNGYQGTVSEWLASLVGPVGPTPAFSIGTVQTGAAGSSAAATITGTAAAPVLNLVIPKGDQGNTGSSVEYPYELVNNRTTDDAKKGLSAAEGKRLGDDLTQLEHEVHNLAGKFYGVFADDSDLPEGDAVGYAFVGTENPYAIWNFDGEEWSDSGSVANGITGEPGVGFDDVSTPVVTDGTFIITLTNGDTITVDLNHNHPQYYSKVAEASNPSGGFLPDVVYSLGTLTGTVAFTLAAAVTGNVNHYFWMFDTGSTAPTVTWPTGITWADGSAPTVAASKHYEVSVLNGIAYYSEV